MFVPHYIRIYIYMIGCGGVFGSNKSSMCWLQSNLPQTCSSLTLEKLHVKHLSNNVDFIELELQKERNANTLLQGKIANRRKRNDEMCALMTMLRSETEAVLTRHNIVLDTPEARAVAQDLSLFSQQEHEQQSSNVDSSSEVMNDATTPLAEEEEDLDHDGDDEGDDDEEEMFEV